jgi:cytidylate kinase
MAIITISRGTMSGGEALAKCLSEELKYPILGREILVEAAARLGVSEETLSQKFERSPGLWDRLSSNRRLYIIAVQATLAEHAASGNLVYHGNAGHLLLRDIAAVMRVRLIAPMEMRQRMLMGRQHLNKDAAAEYIRNVDAERIRWTKLIYGVDWCDPALYDVVINLEKVSLPTACAMVAQMVARPEFLVNDQVKKDLSDFLLGCRVKVALATNVATRNIDFEIKAGDGVVEVLGEMPNAGTLTHASTRAEVEVARVVESVSGVKKVLLNIRKVDAYH